MRLLAILWQAGRLQVVVYSLFIVLPGLLAVASVHLLRELVDLVVDLIENEQAVEPVVGLLVLYLLVDLVKGILFQAGPDEPRNSWSGSSVLERLSVGVRRQLLARISRIPLSTFDDSTFYDRLHRAQTGIENRLPHTTALLFQVPSACVTVMGLLLYVGSVHWLFAVVVLMGVVPLQILGTAILRSQHALERAHAPDQRRLEYFADLLTTRGPAAEVRLHGLANLLTDRWMDAFGRTSDARLQLDRRHLGHNLVKELTPELAYGLVIVGVVALIARDELTAGFLVAFLSAAVSLLHALSNALDSTQTLAVDLEYLEDLVHCLGMAEERTDGEERIGAADRRPPSCASRP